MKKLTLIFAFMIGTALSTSVEVKSQSQIPSVQLQVDASAMIGISDPALWGNIGYDPIYKNTVQPEYIPVWSLMKNNHGFRYIRCHNMFSDGFPGQSERAIYGCRIYSEDSTGTAHYNWRYLDQVLDTWLQAGCKPILETDFMPDALAAGTIVRNYSGGAINPPKDYTKWQELVYQTVKHCIERYGREEVRTWYWEIWNEPDLSQYFGGTVNDLIKMYDYFVAGATAADSLVRIGGPGIAGNETFFRTFLNHCVNGINHVTGKRGTRIDFISWHAYGTLSSLIAKDRRMRSIVLTEFPSLAYCELQQNEWGQRLNPNPQSTMTSYEACFLVKFIDAIYSDSTIQNVKFLRWGSPTTVARAGFGLGWRTLTNIVNGEVIPLSIFNAYDMLGKMGSERVLFTGSSVRDAVHGFATRSRASVGVDSIPAIQVLVYHFQETNEEGIGDSVPVTLTIRGLGNKKEMMLTHYRIDKNHSDAYNTWVAMGSPPQLTSQQIQQLKTKSVLQLLEVPSKVTVSSGQVELSFSLPINAVSLIVLSAESTTGTNNKEETPVQYALLQNYPNPFNPTTTIRFSIPRGERVALKIFDLLGREVATLVDEYKEPGEYSVTFNSPSAKNPTPGTLASGVYYYRLTTPTFSSAKAMMMIK